VPSTACIGGQCKKCAEKGNKKNYKPEAQNALKGKTNRKTPKKKIKFETSATSERDKEIAEINGNGQV